MRGRKRRFDSVPMKMARRPVVTNLSLLFFAQNTLLIIERSGLIMRTYKVMEIAELLNVNEETVRRWIRSDGLKARQTSKKTGNVINEQDLIEFVRTKPKYRKMLCLQEPQIDNAYRETLKGLLIDLIHKRDQINDQINKIQLLLEEES